MFNKDEEWVIETDMISCDGDKLQTYSVNLYNYGILKDSLIGEFNDLERFRKTILDKWDLRFSKEKCYGIRIVKDIEKIRDKKINEILDGNNY
jgi:hypothetical protein